VKQESMNNKYNIIKLCQLAGKSRQAYYKSVDKQSLSTGFEEEIVIDTIKNIRELMPKCGTRKLYHLLKREHKESIHIGRDALFDVLRNNRMLVRQRRKKVVTTHTYHWLNKFDNLIKELDVTRPNQVWVSDITYIRYASDVAYLFLITDLKTRKIMGYKLSINLEAINALEALNMASKTANTELDGLIHHSDHGVQYCSSAYIKMIEKLNGKSSMSAKGNPYENAVAERVNGIIKNEWLDEENFNDYKQLEKRVDDVINTYNTKRLHMSLNYKTPDEVYYQFFNEAI